MRVDNRRSFETNSVNYQWCFRGWKRRQMSLGLRSSHCRWNAARQILRGRNWLCWRAVSSSGTCCRRMGWFCEECFFLFYFRQLQKTVNEIRRRREQYWFLNWIRSYFSRSLRQRAMSKRCHLRRRNVSLRNRLRWWIMRNEHWRLRRRRLQQWDLRGWHRQLHLRVRVWLHWRLVRNQHRRLLYRCVS